MLWEGAASAHHANLACCLGYPKSFGPLTTLPCTAQCNIEISQGGIASAPTSQRAPAFAALTASIPAAGGQRFSQSFPTPPSLPLRVSCAFHHDGSTPALPPKDFQGQDSQLLTPSPRSIASAVHACLRDWTQGPGSVGRRIGDMQFSCPEPKSAYTVDMPGDPRQWWAGALARLAALRKFRQATRRPHPPRLGSSETGSFCPAVGRKVAPQPAAPITPTAYPYSSRQTANTHSAANRRHWKVAVSSCLSGWPKCESREN